MAKLTVSVSSSVLKSTGIARTRANQFGLLGFGGDGSGYTLAPEFSAAVWK